MKVPAGCTNSPFMQISIYDEASQSMRERDFFPGYNTRISEHANFQSGLKNRLAKMRLLTNPDQAYDG